MKAWVFTVHVTHFPLVKNIRRSKSLSLSLICFSDWFLVGSGWVDRLLRYLTGHPGNQKRSEQRARIRWNAILCKNTIQHMEVIHWRHPNARRHALDRQNQRNLLFYAYRHLVLLDLESIHSSNNASKFPHCYYFPISGENQSTIDSVQLQA